MDIIRTNGLVSLTLDPFPKTSRRSFSLDTTLTVLNELSTGLVLIAVAFASFSFDWLDSPNSTTITIEEPVHREEVIGQIPESVTTTVSPLDVRPSNIIRPSGALADVTARVPVFKEGQVVLKTAERTFKGQGSPSVELHRHEVLM